jgi:hypothetical protein
LNIGPNYFLQHFKNKIILDSGKFVATKNGNWFFSPLSLVAVFGSGIRDKHPVSATLPLTNGSGIRIREAQKLTDLWIRNTGYSIIQERTKIEGKNTCPGSRE